MSDITHSLMKCYAIPTRPKLGISSVECADVQKLAYRAYHELCAAPLPKAIQWSGPTSASTISTYGPEIKSYIADVSKLSKMVSAMYLMPIRAAALSADSNLMRLSGLHAVVGFPIPAQRPRTAVATSNSDFVDADFKCVDEAIDMMVVDEEVKRFVSLHKLEADYDFVTHRIVTTFLPELVTVLLLCSQDDDSTVERLTFLVKCNLDRKSFRAACERFYEPLRNDRLSIYTRMSVQRDI